MEACVLHETQPAQVIQGYMRAGLLLRRCPRLYTQQIVQRYWLSELLNRDLARKRISNRQAVWSYPNGQDVANESA